MISSLSVGKRFLEHRTVSCRLKEDLHLSAVILRQFLLSIALMLMKIPLTYNKPSDMHSDRTASDPSLAHIFRAYQLHMPCATPSSRV